MKLKGFNIIFNLSDSKVLPNEKLFDELFKNKMQFKK
jgi:hypothetical protein